MNKRENQTATWISTILMNRMKAAAKRNFRTVGGEIEFRLTESLKDEQAEAKR